MNYKLLSAPTNVLFYILCVLLLMWFYMFQHSRHLQGAYTNAVET